MDRDKKIKKIINCIETDNPNDQYDLISLLHDGPHGMRQVTLGVGLTEFSGDLKKCIEIYVKNNGKYSKELEKYLNTIGNIKYPLANDDEFIDLLKKASEDQVMRDAQDEVFDTLYWIPAMEWAKSHGFEPLPLSMLVIYDSFVQSGQIFQFLRNEFEEPVPSNKGDEKTWIKEYSAARLFWLANHSNGDVRKSAYRMRTYEKLLKNNNWNLDGDIRTDNDCLITDSQ